MTLRSGPKTRRLLLRMLLGFWEKPAAMLGGHSSSSMERSMGQGTEASCQPISHMSEPSWKPRASLDDGNLLRDPAKLLLIPNPKTAQATTIYSYFKRKFWDS